MSRPIALLAVAVLILGATESQAGDDIFDAPPKNKLPPKFLKLADTKVAVLPAKAKRGETVTVRLTVELFPEEGGHTYPFFPRDPEQTSKNVLGLPTPTDPASGGLVFLGGVTDPIVPKLQEEQREDSPPGVMDQYYGSTVTWEFKAVVSPKAKAGATKVGVGKKTYVQVCKGQCIRVSGEEIPFANFEVLDGTGDKVVAEDVALAEKILAGSPHLPNGSPAPNVNVPGLPAGAAVPAGPPAAAGEAPKSNSGHGKKVAKPIEVYTADLATIKSAIAKPEAGNGIDGKPVQEGLWKFILTAAVWGLVSLVTPCVFPMIPITVSIFLKHAHGSMRERLKLAGVYCLTIVSVLGVSAFALLKFMAWLSTNPVTNILLGALFLVLALSLFGMYEITLPNFLSRRLQAKQAKGGVIGTIFGALAFTVISFTCVAPFLGGFAGISAADSASGTLISVPTPREIAGGLAFSMAFAVPFFVLALIPGLLKALPRSGGWLDSVKVVMGFLELAAALKFLRTAELRILPSTEYFTFDLVLGGWVAISFACGLYLLNAYRLPHDEEKPNIGVPRLLFALLFLGLGFNLMPALFKTSDGKAQRPSGAVYAWVEAFLLPETDSEWGTDLKEAVDRARKSGQPVFVDFTGVTCTNCKYNEGNVFSRPDMQLLLGKFERVQLYTDEVPKSVFSSDPGATVRENEAEANRKFQSDVFGDLALPLYVVLVPQRDGSIKILDTRAGKINDQGSFANWLDESSRVK